MIRTTQGDRAMKNVRHGSVRMMARYAAELVAAPFIIVFAVASLAVLMAYLVIYTFGECVSYMLVKEDDFEDGSGTGQGSSGVAFAT